MDEEKEKLVGSLMLRKNGHRTISFCDGEDSSAIFLQKKFISWQQVDLQIKDKYEKTNTQITQI